MAPTERSREERGDVPVAPFPVVDISGVTTQDEIRERKLREAQESRERLRAATHESNQVVGKKDHHRR